MERETLFAVSAAAHVATLIVTVIGWAVAHTANNKNSVAVLKLQESNRAIDEMYQVLRKNYDSILLEFSSEDSSLEYYKRINYVERVRLLCLSLHRTGRYKNEVSLSELNVLIIKLRQISTDDKFFSEENRISTSSKAISLINQFAKVFYKDLS